ncbi:hypothetical protein HOP50_01g01030 [Chloropicon primus]|uniref:UspA domain-containing protein n=1 Tax=Chloropicon primus TaxID=1764295 RepID=A0A5B8MBZ0_9CHLO|nr:hypothetical protein A3770_01p01120 [Chloropicon primus]UPQ96812.1 hypothetical protein HOP50_01g01030 [Chloropicon primus]|eukprot:QDZ17594.1 hypothetical protein A3770_01p01120 [Chloropicon primus]
MSSKTLESGSHEALKETLEAMNKTFNFGVAIDGSLMSLKALDLVCKLMNERALGKPPKVEKLHCFHVENPSKQEALSLQSSHFKHSASLRIDKESMIDMKWHQSHVDRCAQHAGIFSLLEGMARDHKVELLVVGTFGLNGEKKDRIGRMSSFSMANSQIPVFIVKPTFLDSSASAAPRGYFVAVDGLAASSKALLFVIKYLVRKKDKIHLFYKNTREEVKGFFDHYIALLEGMELAYESIYSADKRENVAAEIVRRSSELECEFIVMGKKRTRTDSLLGSISDHVAAKSRSSLIICKDTKF